MAANPEYDSSQNSLNAAIEFWDLQQEALLNSVHEITAMPMRGKEIELREKLYACIRAFRAVMRQIADLPDITPTDKRLKIIELIEEDEHKRVESINTTLEQVVCEAAKINHEPIELSEEDFTEWLKKVCEIQAHNLDIDIGRVLGSLSIRVMEISQWN
jgi:hypothetical protein